MEHLKQMVMSLPKGTYTLDEVYQAMCKAITDNVHSTRASIWLFNSMQTSITCQCLYDTRTGNYEKDAKLTEVDFPEYFAAINHDLKLIASDAENHPATSCFNEVYFEPLEIRSLLDHVVLNAGVPTGVLCCEHCDEIKEWSEDDENFLKQMATILAFTFKYGKVV